MRRRGEMRETLSFKEVMAWFRAAIGDSVSVHVAGGPGTDAFLDGPIDDVMGFESTNSHGLIVDGAAGAWSLHLAEPEFERATLSTIPDSRTAKQLTIKMRDHRVMVAPGLRPDRKPPDPGRS